MSALLARSASPRPSLWGAYRMRLYQALAVYRFLAFALGMGFYFILGVDEGRPMAVLVMAGLVGLANMARVLVPPFRLIRKAAAETALLAGETVLILALVLATGGLDSPFLAHSLSPVLTGSFFAGRRSAASLGVMAGAGLLVPHGAATAGVGPLPGLASGNYLVFVMLYGTAVALTVALPFLTNLNLERRQQALAAAEERRQMQRDLHDDVAQTLAFLSLKAQRAEEHVASGRAALSASDVGDIAQGLRRAYLTVRDLLDAPETRLPPSLHDALQEVAGSWGRALDIPLEFRYLADTHPPLSPGVQRHLLQITREALANAARHGRPTRVWLTLELADQALWLRIRDDGLGMAPGHPRGLGLTGMQERATLIGASLDIRSAPGKGTEVIVRLPLPDEGGAP